MYQLLVKGNGWGDRIDSLPDRVFEFTEKPLKEKFQQEDGVVLVEKLSGVPTLFVSEIGGQGDQFARIGTISRAKKSPYKYEIHYSYDADIQPIHNDELWELRSELGIEDFQFSRTHWAIKDVDLFQVLFRKLPPARQAPRVFKLPIKQPQDSLLISAMMPFSAEFSGVYAAIKDACGDLSLTCKRADDIWDDDSIIQDVVNLIDQSKVVICDCTGKNANVFYEAGIAHTLGRDTILITQNSNDVPFDLQHIRYLTYLNNSEGRSVLKQEIAKRLGTLCNIM